MEYSTLVYERRNIFMAKVLHELAKIDQPGEAEGTSVPPVIVAVVGLGHRDGIADILESDSVPENVEDLLALPIGPDREALSFEEVREKFQLELQNERTISFLKIFNL